MTEIIRFLQRYYYHPYLLWNKNKENELDGLYFGDWRVVGCLGTKENQPYLLIHNESEDVYERVVKNDFLNEVNQ